ncbi:MAG: adenylosuccinate lyase [Candidatus Komeilibacteria bacterium]|nr:adenylosuccinate lyase [Candidatus Komeilibacteria bacterium]
MTELNTISPLDGRYYNKVKELSDFFSETALIRYRLKVEIEYFIALGAESKISEVKTLSTSEQNELRSFYLNFTEAEAAKVKKIEQTTNHDVKAVEYYLKEKFGKIKSLSVASEFIHFALTSEDVNNLSYSLMLKDGLAVYLNQLKKFLAELKDLAVKNKKISLLSLTHGQPATPTTLGKELAIFYHRLNEQIKSFNPKLSGKFSGAVGNWNAQVVAYPKVDWLAFSQKFVEGLGLVFNPLTTQIESHDGLAIMCHKLIRINNVIKNLDQDMWLYISREIFKLKKIAGEIGSSTMPHKVNPIDFENSEGNLGLANAIFDHLANKLPISRLQRDLSDSTVIRNQGVALGYSLLALKMTLKGLSKLEVNKLKISQELNSHWEVLAEPIQVVLRKVGYAKPYETLKNLTRGEKIGKAEIQKFIRSLKIAKTEKENLLKLTPENYTGLASKLVDKYLS